MTSLLIILMLFSISSCAGVSPEGVSTSIAPPTALHTTQSDPAPSKECAPGSLAAPCNGTVGAGVATAGSLGAPLPQSPSLSPPGAPAVPGQPNLPRLGSPVFGPTGLVGTVINHAGNTAIVAPAGGGAPGIYVPNGNGTATIFLPGRVPVVVPAR